MCVFAQLDAIDLRRVGAAAGRMSVHCKLYQREPAVHMNSWFFRWIPSIYYVFTVRIDGKSSEM